MSEKNVGRRSFLKVAGATAGGLIVGGVAGYLLNPGEKIWTTVTQTTTKTVTGTVTASPTAVPWEQYFPRADRILAPWELKWTGLDAEYITTVDWVRSIDWGKVKSKWSGKTVSMACEGVDISAPQTFLPSFQGLTGATLQLFGIPTEEFHEKLMAELTKQG